MDAEKLAKFNPANAANLTESDLQEMRQLTDAEIAELAKAYPNTPAGKSYLILWDDNVRPDKQAYGLSTWQNLNNVRKYGGLKNLRPYTFRSRMQGRKPAPATTTPATRVSVDITPQAAAQELSANIRTETTKQVVSDAVGNLETQQAAGKVHPERPVMFNPETNVAPPPVTASDVEQAKRDPQGRFVKKVDSGDLQTSTILPPEEQFDSITDESE